MAVVCPTVTAYDTHQYRQQMELLEPFAKRIHIDLMDGIFAPTLSPPLEAIWWPPRIAVDLHVMYQKPGPYLDQLIEMKPHLVIIQAEAEVDHGKFADQLRAAGIKSGLALLQDTTVDSVLPLLDHFDHVMIFSGNLGRHGGSKVDFGLLDKALAVRERYPEIEIAWDGGINADNIKRLAEGGIDVFGVGGFIHEADDPQEAYAKLESVIAGL